LLQAAEARSQNPYSSRPSKSASLKKLAGFLGLDTHWSHADRPVRRILPSTGLL